MSDTEYVERGEGYALVTLDYDLTGPQVAERLAELYGFGDIKVTALRTNTNVTYTVIFTREHAAIDFAQLEWGEAREDTELNPNLGASVKVMTDTIQDGAVAEVQTIFVQADNGTYKLRTEGYGNDTVDPETELPYTDTEHVERREDYALVTLDYDLTGPQVAERLAELYGFDDIEVTERRSNVNVTYTVIFLHEHAGINFEQLQWGETQNLNPYPGESVELITDTIREGSFLPQLNNLQTLTVNATGGTYTIHFELEDEEGELQDVETIVIKHDASADDLLDALSAKLNPNNTNPALPYTYNVAVSKHENVPQNESVYHITFQGEHSGLSIESIDTTNLTGTVTLDTRVDGINYYGVDTMNVGLGCDDVYNVQGTTAVTNLNTYDGDEWIYVSSDADYDMDDTVDFLTGHLDNILGQLNIDVGTGRHMLMISDEAAVEGDSDVLISDTWQEARDWEVDLGIVPQVPESEIYIVGLSQGSITYRTDDLDREPNEILDGNYADGITIWSGWGDDTFTVNGTHKRDGYRTVTTLNTGLGNDKVTVDLDVGEDGFFVLNTQGPYNDFLELTDKDTVRAQDSTLPLIIFGGQDDDDITGGTGGDIIFGDRGRVLYFDPKSGVPEINGTDIDTATLQQLENHAVTVLGHGGPGDKTDGVSRDVSLVISVDPTVGGSDIIVTGVGEEIVLSVLGDVDNSGNIDIDDVFFLFQYAMGRSSSLAGVNIAETNSNNLGKTRDIIIGGVDIITTNAGEQDMLPDGNSIVFGDSGFVDYAVVDGNPLDIDRIFSIAPDVGGSDIITTGAGDDIIIGGEDGETVINGYTGETKPDETQMDGGDTIVAGNGFNIVFGDNGQITSATEDNPQFGTQPITLGLVETIESLIGGSDTITTGVGEDIILGGIDADMIVANDGEDALNPDGNNIVLGDSGYRLRGT